MYRPSDSVCSGPDAAVPEVRNTRLKQRWDTLSKEASDEVTIFSLLVVLKRVKIVYWISEPWCCMGSHRVTCHQTTGERGSLLSLTSARFTYPEGWVDVVGWSKSWHGLPVCRQSPVWVVTWLVVGGWWRGIVGNTFRLKWSYSTPGPVSTAMSDCLRAGTAIGFRTSREH